MATINKPTHGSLEWLNVRHRDEHGKVRFGASEAPALVGASKYRTVTDLALEKWADPEVLPSNPAMERGNVLEPALIAHAATLLGESVITPTVMYTEGRLVATLDGLSDSGVIVECKTTTAYSSDDVLPAEYYWQVVAQFCCVPFATDAIVVVLDKFMRLGQWRVVRPQQDCDRLMARAEEIGDYLDRRELPPDAPLTEANVKALWPEPSGSIELGYAGAEIVNHWVALKTQRERLEKEEDAAREQLVALLGQHEAGTVDGEIVVTYKARKGTSTVDWKALNADHPGLIDSYKKQGSPTRVLKSTHK